mmetsp:Transcript_23457/g.39263  ORF Transcript_23457/g.39263 Transcript_23457/m.39263 type:complete len:219 (-) Transcript_23457:8-664(-)
MMPLCVVSVLPRGFALVGSPPGSSGALLLLLPVNSVTAEPITPSFCALSSAASLLAAPVYSSDHCPDTKGDEAGLAVGFMPSSSSIALMISVTCSGLASFPRFVPATSFNTFCFWSLRADGDALSGLLPPMHTVLSFERSTLLAGLSAPCKTFDKQMRGVIVRKAYIVVGSSNSNWGTFKRIQLSKGPKIATFKDDKKIHPCELRRVFDCFGARVDSR